MSKWENHCKDCIHWDGDIKQYGWNRGYYYCEAMRSWEDPDRAYECDLYEYKGKRGCFLTTACCEFYGLPDDCAELTTLRSFRDGYMMRMPNGEAEIAEYYSVAPRICCAIDSQSEECRKYEYEDIYRNTIIPCVKHIREGRNEEAYFLYKDMVQKLKCKYLNG